MADSICNSRVIVGDKKVPFVHWYNETHFKKHHKKKYPTIAKENHFAVMYDNLDKWLKPELMLSEFVGTFLIFCNETGGTFRPVDEFGGKDPDAYFFDMIPGKKKSYNTLAGNIKAGDSLVARGKLDKDKDAVAVAAWNGEAYPRESHPDMKMAARECDFYKLRGRGLLQTRGRTSYLAIVDPALKATKMKRSDDLTDAELSAAVRDPNVYLPMLKAFFGLKAWPALIRGLTDNATPAWKAVGKAIGGSDAHAVLYEERCQTLFDALEHEGWDTA